MSNEAETTEEDLSSDSVAEATLEAIESARNIDELREKMMKIKTYPSNVFSSRKTAPIV